MLVERIPENESRHAHVFRISSTQQGNVITRTASVSILGLNAILQDIWSDLRMLVLRSHPIADRLCKRCIATDDSLS